MDLPPPLHHLRDGRRHTEGHRGSEQGCEVQGLGVMRRISPAGISPGACTSRISFITGGEIPKAAILMRHPQGGSRSVGVVHDEELLAVTSATSIGLIPLHTAMLSRQWLTSGDP